MIYRIEVWLATSSGQQLAGEMVCEVATGEQGKGSFRYAPDYLRLSGAFALDPVSLPLREGTFSIEGSCAFGVFEDSLPDDWGRRLLVRKHQIPRHQVK